MATTSAPVTSTPAGSRRPVVRATIDRRLLVNYRVDPERAARLLPAHLSPQLVEGYAVAGICLIRLTALRPAGVPARWGLASENAAHRVAVTWQDADGPRAGVYIPRRHSASRLTTALGGRLYPGHHLRADFATRDETTAAGRTVSVSFTSRDGATSASVTARTTDELVGSRLFPGTAAASAFFAGGSCGYSPTRRGDRLEGMRLETDAWGIEPCELVEARSSLFDDPRAFPPGTAVLDSALLMQRVPVTWRALGDLAPRG